jgi:hypothetical protein
MPAARGLDKRRVIAGKPAFKDEIPVLFSLLCRNPPQINKCNKLTVYKRDIAQTRAFQSFKLK